MDEATWRTTANGRAWMLEHVRTTASSRKHRLFGCACVRRAWDDLTPDSQTALDDVERVAEGLTFEAQVPAIVSALAQPGAEAIYGVRAILAQAIIRLLGPPEGARHAATDVLRARRAIWRVELAAQCELARCVFGNPFRPLDGTPAWARSATARQMAQVIADEGRYADLPILADALEDVGCADEDVLGHCRADVGHARGCWVIDAILGR